MAVDYGDDALRGTARIAVFAALIAALTLTPGLYILGGQVPVTLQTLAVTLAATVLGPWRGAAAVSVYLAMIAVGLPVATGFRGGFGVFAGVTGGYLVGFVPMAIVIGLIARVALRRLRGVAATLAVFAAGVAGLVVLYPIALPWLMAVSGLSFSDALHLGMWVFLPGDLLKATVAAVVTVAVVRALPGVVGAPRS